MPYSAEVVLLGARLGSPATCDALDLSTSGMLVHPRSSLNTGRTLRLYFPLPVGGRERWIDLDAFQARETSEGEPHGWGLSFVHLPFVAADLLSAYVDEILGQLAMEEERRALL